MNPVTREMERLGWIYQPTSQWYQKTGTQLCVTYNEAKKVFEEGRLVAYLEDVLKRYKKKVRNKG